MSEIKITLHEFKMIRDDYHPEFTFNDPLDEDSLGKIDDEGKGADIIYKKEIVRKSDNKIFLLKSIYNTASDFIHDEPYDCDFIIDRKKEDTLDPFNELDLEGQKKRKLEAQQKEIKEKEEAKRKEELIEFSFDNPIIPPNEFKKLCFHYLEIVTFQDLHDCVDKNTKPLAFKYKIELESLHFSIVGNNKKPAMMKLILKYEKAYNKKHDIVKTIPLKIKGEIIDVNEKEARSILRQLKDEF